MLASYLLVFLGIIFLLGFGSFGLASLREREKRAAGISFGLALAGFALFILITFLPPPVRLVVLVVTFSLLLVLLGLFLLPLGQIVLGSDQPQSRFDERDIMFARYRLKPGSPEYAAYYSMRPENQASDDRIRLKPGLLSPDSQLADPFHFASAEGSFDLTHALREAVDGPVSSPAVVDRDCHPIPVEQMTCYMKNLALYYGALDVGVAALQPYHVYSHVGRGTGVYGEPISIRHLFAIAFTVEMDFHMVASSPNSPIVMESARQYVNAASIAVQLAGVIRYLGHSARAHIDGNYQVIAPLVARDAGLGEIGRMGLLMTPGLGPRVRLGVVTTDLDLIPDHRLPGGSVVDFCTICKKCAESCPSQAIPFDHRQELDGAMRWRIDSDSCFHYWNVIGTDCGRCMAVCPFSHPESIHHNLVRWGITRSGFFRRLALKMDDLFYGRRPASREAPPWTRIS